jgi:membrane dipeptidase
MNAKNVIVDVSHASVLTCADVFKTSKKAVIISHGAAHALCKSARCSPDEVIQAVADSGGVFGVFMMSCWLTDDPVATVEHLIAQLRHIINVGGIEAVGISNDYLLTGEQAPLEDYYPWWQEMAALGLEGFDELPKHIVIPELNNLQRMFTIDAALKKAGFTCSERDKIMGGNWVRLLKQELG